MGTPIKITPIGVICHEMGHTLGLPDLYDTTDRSAGLGGFSLMAGGSGRPRQRRHGAGPPDVWSRGVPGLGQPDARHRHHRRPAPAPRRHQHRRDPPASGMPASQYFLLENRSRSGYDQYLPADGLAIYHVDELMPDNSPYDA
jgi:immune inhibitor A